MVFEGSGRCKCVGTSVRSNQVKMAFVTLTMSEKTDRAEK